MRRLFLNGGTLAATVILAAIMARTAQEAGTDSSTFLWSALICAAVLVIALAVRWRRDRRS